MVADGEGKAHGEARRGRLWARPVAHAQATESGAGSPGQPPSGLRELGLDRTRDGLLYIPAGYRDDRPAPLVLMLHGAGGVAHHGLNPLLAHADEAGLILLAPDSRGPTWDVIRRGYGPDITYIDRALAQTFTRYAVDPTRIAIHRGLLQRGVLRALSGPHQRRPLHPRHSVLARIHGPGGPPRQAARFYLARPARRGVTYRPLQPPHCAPTGARRLRPDLP